MNIKFIEMWKKLMLRSCGGRSIFDLLSLKSYYKNWLKWFDLIFKSEHDSVEVVRNPKRPIGAWIHY